MGYEDIGDFFRIARTTGLNQENIMSYVEDLFSLKGKTAVVIGGTGELCSAMAMAMARAGAEIVLVGRDEKKAKSRLERIHTSGGSGYFEAADVISRKSLESMLARIVAKSGKCEILVNGAGINSTTPFLEVPEDEYDRVFATNAKGVFLACQVFGEYFLENHISASIINVGSMSGIIPLSRVFSYSMSKAAVHNISKNLAREWATKDIRVNTLIPGFFPAEQNRKVLTPDRIQKILDHTPMNRFGEAQELSGATLLLASQAGSFITGEEIVVDGGYAAMTI
jgi:NAD(P)-dependent dehydrogenase (short-subunit alcohol dehydrogenase family)